MLKSSPKNTPAINIEIRRRLVGRTTKNRQRSNTKTAVLWDMKLLAVIWKKGLEKSKTAASTPTISPYIWCPIR